MASRTLSVTITGDSKGAKDAFKDVEVAAAGIQGKLATLSTGMKDWGDKAVSLGKSISMNISLPIAALGAVAFKELAESQKVAAQTNAVLASTGGAANVTAAQVDKLATSLMKKSGIDDEAIKSGENLLLTFTKIRNEAGKGNDIFNRATKAALDLSIAFGTDMQSASIMLGKALNDPIAGLTSLSKKGVQFTAEQKDMIKGFVEAGDIMSAQKMILKELETQVGGSADAYGKTLPGQIGRAKEALMNSSALILATAAPAFEHLASAAGKVAEFLAHLPGPAREAVAAFAAVAVAAGPVVFIAGKIAQASSYIVTGFKAVVSAAQAMPAVLNAAKTALVAFATNPYAIAIIATVTAVTALTMALRNNSGALKQAAEEGRKYGQSMVDAATVAGGGLTQLKSQMAGFRAEMEAAHPTHEVSREDLYKYAAANDVLKGKLDEARQAHHDAKVAEEARVASLQGIANGTMDVTDASEDAVTALQALQSTLLATSGGEIGYQQSLINQEKAQRELNDTLAQYPATSEQARTAQLNLDQANLQVASSALGLNDNLDKIKKQIEGDGSYDALMARLVATKEKYGDASGAIQQQIDKLFWLKLSIDNLPESKSTTINANTADAEAAIARVRNGLFELLGLVPVNVGVPPLLRPPEGAEGAIVSRPTIALIGEAGPEALVPLNRTPGNSPLPSGIGVGGDTTIVVQLDSGVLLRALVPKVNQQAQAGPVFVKAAIAS